MGVAATLPELSEWTSQTDIKFPHEIKNAQHFQLSSYSPFHGFWQSFISIEVCRDCILASSCKKQLTGFFVCLLFFLKVNTSVKFEGRD